MTFLSAMSTKVKMEAIVLYVGYYISQFTRCIVMTSLDDRLDTKSERFWYNVSHICVICNQGLTRRQHQTPLYMYVQAINVSVTLSINSG